MNDPGLLVMLSLASGPRHGYAIQQDIHAFAGQRLGPGTLYGAIARLEREGLIAGQPGSERQKPYALTPAGKDRLEQRLANMRQLAAVGGARLSRA